MEQKKVRIGILTLLIIAIILLTVAFAAMSTVLTINGTGIVDPGGWGVKFENLSAPILKGGASVETPAKIEGETEINDFRAVLTKPGDSVSYKFDIKNYGQINAQISSLTKQTPVCTGLSTSTGTADSTIVSSNISYTLTYTSNGSTVAKGDILNAGETKNVTLTLKYNSDTTQLPSNDVEISGLDVTLVYGQVVNN